MIRFIEFLKEKDIDLYNEAKDWIQGAVKKPGSFTSYCGGEVTQDCIEKGKNSKDPLTRKRANLASTFKKISKKKKKKNG